VLVPFSLGVVAGSALTRPLGARLSVRRLAAAGLAGIAAGNLLLVLTYGSVAGVVAGVAVTGIGLGVASVAGTAIGTDLADTLSGTAGGVLNTGAQLGTAVGSPRCSYWPRPSAGPAPRWPGPWRRAWPASPV